MHRTSAFIFMTIVCAGLWLGVSTAPAMAKASGITIVMPGNPGETMHGRIVLVVSPKATPEPRLQVELEAPLRTPYIFGQNVGPTAAGTKVALDLDDTGWPTARLSELPPGEYWVQAVLNRYELFHRADGSIVDLAPEMGEGQQWNKKPGNPYSKPTQVRIGAGAAPVILTLDQVVPPITPPADTTFVKHIRIKSELLSHYWGRDVYLGAHVLVPAGFAAHPEAHFPLMVFHGHFPDDISEFRTEPPDPNLKPEYSDRFHLAGYNLIEQREAYQLYQTWISKDFPRFLVVEIQHANPYYDDSYAVNSANLGPYGDAINKELIPAIEQQFRGLGQRWARFTYGGSTGGWEAMATQVFYPDMYNGAFAACPDPIDFKGFTNIDLYADPNAFETAGVVNHIERPAMRDYLGETLASQRDENQMELVLGDKGRSGQQYDIWQAVFGPQGADGYPVAIFDKQTGVIDAKAGSL
jgi:hypothetical protein